MALRRCAGRWRRVIGTWWSICGLWVGRLSRSTACVVGAAGGLAWVWLSGLLGGVLVRLAARLSYPQASSDGGCFCTSDKTANVLPVLRPEHTKGGMVACAFSCKSLVGGRIDKAFFMLILPIMGMTGTTPWRHSSSSTRPVRRKRQTRLRARAARLGQSNGPDATPISRSKATPRTSTVLSAPLVSMRCRGAP